jgi:hypothetical protein
MARLTYANVVSTLALVLAVTGTSAYAAGKINGHELKKGTVTGKAVKNHSLTVKDLRAGTVPANATALSATLVAADTKAQLPLTAIGGLSISGNCATGATTNSPNQGFRTAALFVSSSGAGARFLPEGSTGNVAPAPGQAVAVANATGKEYVTTSFTWSDSQGVRAGMLSARFDEPTLTCQFTGWILHP